ncbi:hypothetical protein K438DRAFT_1963033 [Mycena galopus ATCC 62051]|nr:hypothetical protein K438DRAFT_1963033 [Mycena galopus ATCC 62051]
MSTVDFKQRVITPETRRQRDSNVFAYHVRATAGVPANERNYPQAALATSTVAVERAYSMWATGNLAQQKVTHKNRKSVHSFVTVPWAARAAKYLTIVKKLSPAKWEEIEDKASDLFEGNGKIVWGGGDETSEGPDPRLEIQLSDDEEYDQPELDEEQAAPVEPDPSAH